MNEWKELKIDNLPSDILTGDYELEYMSTVQSGWGKSLQYPKGRYEDIIHNLIHGDRYRYRKPEPLPPIHEEIMTKWWKFDKDWFKVSAYRLEEKYPYLLPNRSFDGVANVDKQWFTNRESAVFPPEAI